MAKLPELLVVNFEKQASDYFKTSSLHGVSYLIDTKSKIEKFFWLIVLKISLISCLVIISYSWEKFQSNPIITGLDIDHGGRTILYPSIYVCPDNPINPKLIARMDELEFPNEDVIECLISLSKFNMQHKHISPYCENISLPATYSLRNELLKVVYKCEEYLSECYFKGESIPCCSDFRPVYTENGFCFVFNNAFEEENGTLSKIQNLKQVAEIDGNWKIKLNIFHQNNESHSKIFIANPYGTLTSIIQPVFKIGNASSLVFITITETYTSDSVKTLLPKQRRCLIEEEYHMMEVMIVKHYDFSQCLKVCHLKWFDVTCGCIPYFYGNLENVRECDLQSYNCIYKNMIHIQYQTCKCEYNCNSFEYAFANFENIKMLENENSRNIQLKIDLREWPMIRYQTDVIFGWVQLLASFGGIASFFLGFSLLSAVELIYSFTLRFCFSFKTDKNILLNAADNRRMKRIKPVKMSLEFFKRKANTS